MEKKFTKQQAQELKSVLDRMETDLKTRPVNNALKLFEANHEYLQTFFGVEPEISGIQMAYETTVSNVLARRDMPGEPTPEFIKEPFTEYTDYVKSRIEDLTFETPKN